MSESKRTTVDGNSDSEPSMRKSMIMNTPQSLVLFPRSHSSCTTSSSSSVTSGSSSRPPALPTRMMNPQQVARQDGGIDRVAGPPLSLPKRRPPPLVPPPLPVRSPEEHQQQHLQPSRKSSSGGGMRIYVGFFPFVYLANQENQQHVQTQCNFQAVQRSNSMDRQHFLPRSTSGGADLSLLAPDPRGPLPAVPPLQQQSPSTTTSSSSQQSRRHSTPHHHHPQQQQQQQFQVHMEEFPLTGGGGGVFLQSSGRHSHEVCGCCFCLNF